MVSAIEAISSQVKSGLCFILSQGEAGAGFVSRVYGTSFGAYSGAAGLRRQFCSDDPDNDPQPVSEFTGGQCEGVSYRVQYTSEVFPFQDCSTFGPAQSTQFLTGPLKGTFRRTSPNAQFPLCTPGGNEVVMRHGNPTVETVLAGGLYGATVTGITVTRADNQPDLCGDPPPIVGPPVPIIFPPGDVTYNIDDSTEITVPLSVVVAPVFLSFDGSLKVPISINLGGLDFDGSVTIAPQFELNIKPSIRIGGPGSVDDPEVIGEPGGGPTPIEDPEDLESTIVGVLVYSDIDSDSGPSGIDFENGPDLYVPRLASVQFAIKTSDSIAWTSDQDVKNLECYVPCPAPQGAIAVRVDPMPGVQSRFTAVRGIPLTSF